MGELIDQKPVKLVASIIFKEDSAGDNAINKLKKEYGLLEDLSLDIPFDFTDYYYEEFGGPLKRKMICFRKLISKEVLADIKLATNVVEDRSRKGGKRTVNIDPGYVAEGKFALLTTKDYTHRIYIGKRIFAESTLFFQDGNFRPWPWTYPDYAQEPILGFIKEVRGLYIEDITRHKR